MSVDIQIGLPLERQPVTVYEIIGQLARDPNVDISRIAGLMELQERAEKREAEKAFIAALNRLMPRLPRVVKHGKIDFESQKTGKRQVTPFAKYEDVDAVIRPLLTEEGFSIGFGTSSYDKGLIITCTLAHCQGHARTESMPLPLDTSGSKNALQAVGSTLSYGKRYLVCAMLNIITVGEDDDGNGGQGYVTRQQADELRRLVTETGATDGTVLRTYDAKTFEDVHAVNYAAAVNLLLAKYRETLKRKGMDEEGIARTLKGVMR